MDNSWGNFNFHSIFSLSCFCFSTHSSLHCKNGHKSLTTSEHNNKRTAIEHWTRALKLWQRGNADRKKLQVFLDIFLLFCSRSFWQFSSGNEKSLKFGKKSWGELNFFLAIERKRESGERKIGKSATVWVRKTFLRGNCSVKVLFCHMFSSFHGFCGFPFSLFSLSYEPFVYYRMCAHADYDWELRLVDFVAAAKRGEEHVFYIFFDDLSFISYFPWFQDQMLGQFKLRKFVCLSCTGSHRNRWTTLLWSDQLRYHARKRCTWLHQHRRRVWILPMGRQCWKLALMYHQRQKPKMYRRQFWRREDFPLIRSILLQFDQEWGLLEVMHIALLR